MSKRSTLASQRPRWKSDAAQMAPGRDVISNGDDNRDQTGIGTRIVSRISDDRRAVRGLLNQIQTEELEKKTAGVLLNANVALDEDRLTIVVSDLNKTRIHYKAAFENLLEVGRALVSIQTIVGAGGYRALERAHLIQIGEATASKLRQIALAIDTGKIPGDLVDSMPRNLKGAYMIASLPSSEVVQTMRVLIEREVLPHSPVSRLEGEIRSLRVGSTPRSRRGELEQLLDKRLRAREALDREIAALQATLKSLDDNGSYGNGEDAGAPIGLRRLEVQPTATRTIEAQAEQERQVPDTP
jgi:hypothetical protein